MFKVCRGNVCACALVKWMLFQPPTWYPKLKDIFKYDWMCDSGWFCWEGTRFYMQDFIWMQLWVISQNYSQINELHKSALVQVTTLYHEYVVDWEHIYLKKWKRIYGHNIRSNTQLLKPTITCKLASVKQVLKLSVLWTKISN